MPDKPKKIAPPRILVIACGVLALDIEQSAREMGLAAGTRFATQLLEGGLHNNPVKLRETLQAAIDTASASGKWDRIAIGYGICGRGSAGIRARSIPLAIPKVHDCIALFLGGDAAYRRQFKRYPGTYYLSAGWYEEKTEPLTQKRPYVYLGEKRLYWDDLEKRYGRERARETFDFLSSWQRNYQRAAFIDTGAGNPAEVARHAREMAGQYGWRFETLPGDTGLLKQLLGAAKTTPAVLVVPPGHITVFDACKGELEARPMGQVPAAGRHRMPQIDVVNTPPGPVFQGARTGLGIDAGGTYTDAVVYDLSAAKVLAKHKALTTKWDFTVGIREALSGLEESLLNRVELVAVSTTLATNAIVEGDGQTVGLLVMPPYGLFDRADIVHEPKAVIAGRLEITGGVIEPVDARQTRRTAHRMLTDMGVTAFAVSGFAASINPEQEMEVKSIIERETGCFVSCGHELSDLLNFRTRAETAVLNARIVPRLVAFIDDLKQVLSTRAIDAPVMVVKGDGSLMSTQMAAERPVETILSGPAASVAGARHLTRITDALVVDMGGTTTDTAVLSHGEVKVVDRGSRVGGVQTHVKALEIRTAGLGGDSLIAWDGKQFAIGPRRVAPMAWLGHRSPGPDRALSSIRKLQVHAGTGRHHFQIFTLNARNPAMALTATESLLVNVLARRPHALDELARAVGVFDPGLLPLGRLEAGHMIQRCGFTPTDLLHISGEFRRWNADSALEIGNLFSAWSGIPVDDMVAGLLDQMARSLAMELIKKQLDGEIPENALETCEACRALFDAMCDRNNKRYRVRFQLRRPVIGIGAPVGHFLPQAAKLLATTAILPQHADVANAIGAITSRIAIRRQAKVRPDQDGGFCVVGLTGPRWFADFESAQEYARKTLCRTVRTLASEAGTAESRVELQTRDHTAHTATGESIFLERIISALLVGPPHQAPGRQAA